MKDIELLIEAARKKGEKTSSIELAKITGDSQQTISRKLKQMEKNGLIRRTVSPKGQKIEMTQKGIEILREQYTCLKEIFEGRKKTEIKGTVETGLKEGRYYMSLPQYREQIKRKIGFDPYPGTLNLRAETDDFALKEPILVEGFSTKDRSYGGIKCHKAKIGRIDCAVIFPERAHHKSVIEVIAGMELRKKLRLKDGSKVKIEVL